MGLALELELEVGEVEERSDDVELGLLDDDDLVLCLLLELELELGELLDEEDLIL